MTSIDIEQTAEINASAEDLWRILGEEFTEVGRWASAIDSSAALPGGAEADPDRPAAGRTCHIGGFGDTEERLVLFDRRNRRLAYTATASRIPSFVHDLRNEWNVAPADGTRSRVTAHITAEATGVLGALMAPFLRRKLGSTLRLSLEDLRIYAESGQVSEARRESA